LFQRCKLGVALGWLVLHFLAPLGAEAKPCPGVGGLPEAHRSLLLPGKEAPELHRYLQGIFSPLAQEQNRMAGELYRKHRPESFAFSRVKSCLVIIQSAQKSAYISYPSWFAKKTKTLQPVVAITTGLIQDLMQGGNPAEIQQRFAGVFSHELAHVLQNYEDPALTSNLRRAVYSQANELYADHKAIEISRRAGFAPESIHTALSRVFWHKAEEEVKLSSQLLHSHPHHSLRLQSLALALTNEAFEAGEQAPKRSPASVGPALAEARALGKYPFTMPQDIRQVRQRLEWLAQQDPKELSKKGIFPDLERHILLGVFDKLGAEPDALKVPAQRQEFLNVLKIFQLDPPRLDRKEVMAAFGGLGELQASIQQLPEHQAALRSSPLYRDSEMILSLLRSMEDRHWLGHRPTIFASLPVTNALKFLSPELVFETLQRASLQPDDILVHFLRGIGRIEEAVFAIGERNALLWPEVIFQPEDSDPKRIKLQFGASEWSLKGRYGIPPSLPLKLASGQSAFENILKRHPGDTDLHRRIDEIARFAWQNRGTIGLLDAIGQYELPVDWEFIWKRAGLSSAEGRQELIRSTRAAIETLNLHELGGEFSRTPLRNAPELSPRRKPWTSPSWRTLFPDSKLPSLEGSSSAFRAFLLAHPTSLVEQASSALLADREWMLALSKVDPEKISFTILERMKTWMGNSQGLSEGAHGSRSGVVARVIDGSDLPPGKKQLLFRTALLERPYWSLSAPAEVRREIVALLNKNGIPGSATGFLLDGVQRMSASRSELMHGREDLARFFQNLEDVRPAELDSYWARLSSGERSARLGDLSDALLNPYRRRIENHSYSHLPLSTRTKPAAQQIKDWFAARALELPLSPDDTMKFFAKLTVYGPSPAADRYFEARVSPALLERGWQTELHGKTVSREFLKPENFSSEEAASRAARKLFDAMHARGETREAFLLMDTLLPEPSAVKDALLEKIAWDHNLRGQALQEWVESRKTYGIKDFNRFHANRSTVAAALAHRFSSSEREEMIRYFSQYEARPLPERLRLKIEHSLLSDPLASWEREELKVEKIRKLISDLELTQARGAHSQRLPLVQLMLAAEHRHSSPEELAIQVGRKLLGFAPGSTEEKTLIAGLKSLPEYRRLPTVAFVASAPQGDGSALTRLFEAFRIVGKKFGQNASMMKVFGEKESAQLALLKDQAQPLSLAEIERQMRKELSSSQLAKIKRLVRVVGAASIKTVVEVELVSGAKAVMFVKPEHAENQVNTNIRLAQKFLQELRAQQVDIPSGMFDMLLEDLERQILPELDFRNEARHIREAQKVLGSADPGTGWKPIQVPQAMPGLPVTQNIMFVEMAQGAVGFDSLSLADRRVVGGQIVDHLLDAFYEKGWSEADRHKGNFLFDPRTKTPYMIDLAQATRSGRLPSFLPDDRYRVAQFLRAVSDKDPKAVVHFARSLAERGREVPAATLEAAVAEVFRRPGLSTFDQWIGILNELAEKGVKLDSKFTLYVMKFHMSLGAEGYVPAEEFEAKVASRIERLLRHEKLPITALDELRLGRLPASSCSGLFQKIFRRPINPPAP
jgi:predicted unusual protein kinase regulating ubiquinone biosynthesis (AarF/ABC1/UbiB family)